MDEIELLEVEPNAGTYTCTKFTIVYKGVTYTVEEWFTDSSSGIEVYDEQGRCVNGSAPQAVREWEPTEDMRVTHFWGRYQGEVVPLMERISKEVLGLAAPPLDHVCWYSVCPHGKEEANEPG